MKSVFTVLFFLFCCSTITVLGQTFIPNYSDFTTRLAPTAPTAAAFQKYGDIPVDITTASQNISIPFTTLKVGDFSWPLSISYHGNGSKVADVATDVGLGWVFNGLGMISSKMTGGDDIISANDFDAVARPLDVIGMGGHGPGTCTYPADAELALEYSQGITNGLPDVFYLNEPLYTGKFFLKGNDSGYTMPASMLKIKLNRNATIGLTAWQITDEHGNKFFYDSSGVDFSHFACTNGQPSLSFNARYFYLTKIITNKNLTIDFYYASTLFYYQNPKEETSYIPAYGSCNYCQFHGVPADFSCSSNSGCFEKRLDSIKCSTGQLVTFKYSARSDIPYGGFKLDSIIQSYRFSSTPVTVKKWSLSYDYFNHGSTDTNALRLQLTKVSAISPDGLTTADYSLNYSTVPLPSRLSFAVDSFGYYNGIDTNTTYLTNRANRKSSKSYAVAGILTKITYPTGGYSTFGYGINRVCGGNELDTVADYDGSGSVTNFRTYVYKSSLAAPLIFRNQLGTYPSKFDDLENGCIGETSQCANDGVHMILYQYNCGYYRYRSTALNYPVYSTFSSMSRYDTVYEYFGASKENGYNQYILGYPQNFTSSFCLGIDNKVLITNTFKLAKDQNYYLLSSKVDSFSIVPQNTSTQFPTTTDVRLHYTFGAIVELNREEVITPCAGVTDCTPRVLLANYATLVSVPLYKTAEINTNYVRIGATADSLKTTTTYSYSTMQQYEPIKINIVNSKGESISTYKKYAADIAIRPGHAAVYDSLVKRNRHSEIVIDSVVKDPSTTMSYDKKNFASWYNWRLIEPSSMQQSIKGSPLADQVVISQYDSSGNAVELKGRNGVITTILYGYHYNFPVATIIGATYASVMTQLSSLGASNDARYSALQAIFDSTKLNSALASIRTLPNTLVTSYTHSPFIGISSETPPNLNTAYYEYEGLGRLAVVRDKNFNIFKKICYNFSGKTESCPYYYNDLKTGTFSRSNCGAGYTTSPVTYTVAANKYGSPSSKLAANALAQDDVEANGQQYADINGVCTPIMITIQGYNSKSSTYNLRFTNNVTHNVYYFILTSGSSLTTLGQIPYGTSYTVLFYPQGAPLGACTYDINGFTQSNSTGGATFNNISIIALSTARMY